jgi:hypothetical protein
MVGNTGRKFVSQGINVIAGESQWIILCQTHGIEYLGADYLCKRTVEAAPIGFHILRYARVCVPALRTSKTLRSLMPIFFLLLLIESLLVFLGLYFFCGSALYSICSDHSSALAAF